MLQNISSNRQKSRLEIVLTSCFLHSSLTDVFRLCEVYLQSAVVRVNDTEITCSGESRVCVTTGLLSLFLN